MTQFTVDIARSNKGTTDSPINGPIIRPESGFQIYADEFLLNE